MKEIAVKGLAAACNCLSRCCMWEPPDGQATGLQSTTWANYQAPPHRAPTRAPPAAAKSWLPGTLHHFSSTESPVRGPFPAATAAPRSTQAGLGLLNPSPGQPPTTSNRPHIRREQRGSPVQLAQGGCSPKPLVPTQPQDPSARTPALQLHVARVHTCLRPCASPRVDLLRPSTSAAHAPPALCAQLQTCHQDKRHEPVTPNEPRAGARHVSALHDTCHRPPKHPSHHSHHTTCTPAHISPRRAERPRRHPPGLRAR